MPLYKVRGQGQELEVYDDRLVITTKGLTGLLTRGPTGALTIPFLSITSIDHRPCGFMNGYLQFTIPGGVQTVLFDQNKFIYSNSAENAVVAQIKAYIEKRIPELKSAQAGSGATSSTADELAKLGNLKERGLLSEEEFVKAKRRIIGE